MAELKRRSWFLPETPDMVGLLRDQLAVTIEGVDMLAGWAAGDPFTAAQFREVEDRGDSAKRNLLDALRRAFVTTLEPEDLFMLSREIDWVLNGAGDLVSEAEVLESGPDDRLAEMARLLAQAVHELDAAIIELDRSSDRAIAAADTAIGGVREMRQAYYRGLATTSALGVRGERIARRELYRRCAAIGDAVVDVAERVVYSVVKES